jgi:hypothetical protein
MELAIVPVLNRPLRPEGKPDPLRDQLATLVESSVLELLDPARLEAMAEDMRVLERHRTHHVGLVGCAMVLSALQRSTDTQGRFLDAQRTYEALGGPEGSASGFRYQARKSGPVLQKLLRRRMDAMRKETDDPELRGRLAAFRDVLIPDGCAFKLARALSHLYSGTGQQAELKLHAVYSVRSAGVTSVETTSGSVHDSDGFWPEWQAEALYIWDLGFTSNERFVDAVQAESHVVQRLKTSGNPVVLASYGETGTRRELREPDHGGPLRLADACAFGLVHKQRVLDLDVQIRDGKRRTVVARVVCVPFGGEDRYYLTTLPRSIFTPHDVAELYRVRWEVELFFRNWKGAVRLDEVGRLQNPDSLLAVVSASMLAAVLAQGISKALDHLARECACAASNSAAAGAASP